MCSCSIRYAVLKQKVKSILKKDFKPQYLTLVLLLYFVFVEYLQFSPVTVNKKMFCFFCRRFALTKGKTE